TPPAAGTSDGEAEREPCSRSAPPRATRRSERANGSAFSAQPFAADVLVGPVLAVEGPVFLVVAQVALGLQRVDDRVRQEALRERFHLELELLLLAEHGLDSPQASAVEQPREALVEAAQSVFRTLDGLGHERSSELFGLGVERRGARAVLLDQTPELVPTARSDCLRNGESALQRRRAQLQRLELLGERCARRLVSTALRVPQQTLELRELNLRALEPPARRLLERILARGVNGRRIGEARPHLVELPHGAAQPRQLVLEERQATAGSDVRRIRPE